MHFVYILRSVRQPSRLYTGRTCDLRRRLERHNSGRSPHTSKFRPWRIEAMIGISDEQRAIDLERYLKSAQAAHSPDDTCFESASVRFEFGLLHHAPSVCRPIPRLFHVTIRSKPWGVVEASWGIHG